MCTADAKCNVLVIVKRTWCPLGGSLCIAVFVPHCLHASLWVVHRHTASIELHQPAPGLPAMHEPPSRLQSRTNLMSMSWGHGRCPLLPLLQGCLPYMSLHLTVAY